MSTPANPIVMDGPFAIKREAVLASGYNEAERTVEVSFSSETPIFNTINGQRFLEILGHNEDEVDLSVLNTVGAVLWQHDRNAMLGGVQRAWIGDDRKGRALIKFSSDELATRKAADVKDGILRAVSVGAEVLQYRQVGMDGDIPIMRATKWIPREISLLPMPADASVGVGREHKPIVKEDRKMSDANSDKPDVAVIQREAQKVERTRIAELNKARSLAASRGFEVPESMFEKAVSEGWDSGKLSYEIMDTIAAKGVKRGADLAVLADIQRGSKEEFSVVKVLRARMNGKELDGMEAEVVAECKRLWSDAGLRFTGDVIPSAALSMAPGSIKRDLAAGNFSAGGATVSVQMGELVEQLKNQSLLSRLGVRRLTGLTGNLTLPRKTGASTAYWVAEGNNPSSSNPTTDDIPFSPKGLAVEVRMNKQWLLQTSISGEAMVRQDIDEELELGIDTAFWIGSGVEGVPQGIYLKATGTGAGKVQTVTFGGAPTWKKVIEFGTKLRTANSNRGSLYFVMSPAVMGAWQGTSKDAGSGRFLIDDVTGRANGYEVFDTNQFGSTYANRVILGNFNDSIIGEWGGVDLTVDPYTLGPSKVKITALKHVDIAHRHLESFVVSTDAGNQ